MTEPPAVDGVAEDEAQTRTRILVVDNYDSFAYNLVQYVAEAVASAGPAAADVGEVADTVIVRRNDEIDLEDVRDLDPTGIVVSPGPGTPQDAGISMPLFAKTEYPILAFVSAIRHYVPQTARQSSTHRTSSTASHPR